VRKVFIRLGASTLAAAASLFGIAALTISTPPAGNFTPAASLAHAALPPEQASSKVDVLSRSEIARIVNRAAKGDLMPRPAPTSFEFPPSAGTFGNIELLAPHDDASLPTLAFLSSAEAEAAVNRAASFMKLAAPPQLLAQTEPRSMRVRATPPPQLLAYAAPNPITNAPFDALIGDLRGTGDGPPTIDFFRRRPSEAVVREWLSGRSIGQFAAGQHEWVVNPLPASVHDAKQQKCLAEGIYFEARGESELGQAAVAQVILNRVRNPAYPDTICDVVYQNKNKRGACQFSFACDGIADRVRSRKAWRTAQRIAGDVTDGRIWIEEVGDSTHYHANYVHPRWGRSMIQADTIGAHIFYRTKNGGWS
jgi:spore germination cell wall hydrolase CwlJ-like protein